MVEVGILSDIEALRSSIFLLYHLLVVSNDQTDSRSREGVPFHYLDALVALARLAGMDFQSPTPLYCPASALRSTLPTLDLWQHRNRRALQSNFPSLSQLDHSLERQHVETLVLAADMARCWQSQAVEVVLHRWQAGWR